MDWVFIKSTLHFDTQQQSEPKQRVPCNPLRIFEIIFTLGISGPGGSWGTKVVSNYISFVFTYEKLLILFTIYGMWYIYNLTLFCWCYSETQNSVSTIFFVLSLCYISWSFCRNCLVIWPVISGWVTHPMVSL